MRLGEEKAESTYHDVSYDGQTSADYLPKTKNCRRLALVGEKGVVRVTEFFEFITKYDEEKYDAIFS